MPLSDRLLKAFGIANSGLASDSVVPQANNLASREAAERRFDQAGALANPDAWTSYQTIMRQPQTLEEQMRLWEEMSAWDLVAAALVELSEEATQPDFISGKTIWYTCSDKKKETELNTLLETIEAESVIQSQVYYVAAFGNNFEKLHYAPGKGVLGMSFAHPMDVRRHWLVKNRRCVGFRWKQQQPDKTDIFQQNNMAVPRVAIGNSSSAEDLWYPWDFLHMRRMQRMRTNEHGEPLFNEAQGVYKKLRVAIDQMLVYRAQIQPDRYTIKVDVKDQAPADQYRTVQRWKQQLRSKMSFGSGANTGQMNLPTDYKVYYDPWALDTVLFIAQPSGFQHAIDKIAGTTAVPDVFDIELLMNLFYSVMGMPQSWFGAKSGGESGGQAPASGKALLAQDMRFLRKVKSVRRPLIDAYTWLAYFHILLQGDNPENYDIEARMSDVGSLEDQMRLELLTAQIDLLGKVTESFKTLNVPDHVIVELLFKRYMHLPDDFVNAVIVSLPAEKQPMQEATGVKIGPALRLIEEATKKSPDLVHKIRSLYETTRVQRLPGKRIYESFRQHPTPNMRKLVEAGDMVVASYDQIKNLSEGLVSAASRPKTTESATRRWGPGTT